MKESRRRRYPRFHCIVAFAIALLILPVRLAEVLIECQMTDQEEISEPNSYGKRPKEFNPSTASDKRLC